MIEVLRLLHAQAEATPAYCGSYYVRHLYSDESLPAFEKVLIDSPLIQRDWIWVAYHRYTEIPLAILIACPCQGVALLCRIHAIKTAPKSILVGLLRKSLADILGRGYTRYAVYLDPNREAESSLIDIAKKSGAVNMGGSHVMLCGSTDTGRW